MKIDVILATYNRAALLERAVQSLLAARCAAACDYAITIIDNNSTDNTAQVAQRLAAAQPERVQYLFESQQGKAYAVNAGIAATRGEIVALADDDQVMCEDWLSAIHEAVAAGFDYVTGPVHGDWEVVAPAWYDNRLRGTLSLFDGGAARVELTLDNTPAGYGFSGGNGAVRRAALAQVGGYHAALGKQAGTFAMCEDGELFVRLQHAGFRGLYEPRMLVRHHIPRERVNKGYFRRWYYGYGWSQAVVDTLHPKPVKYWFGVPRFVVRRGLEALPRLLQARLRGDQPGAFMEELQVRFTLGFLAGKRQFDLSTYG